MRDEQVNRAELLQVLALALPLAGWLLVESAYQPEQAGVVVGLGAIGAIGLAAAILVALRARVRWMK